MKNLSLIVVASAAIASAAGCVGYERKSVNGPSATGVNALSGHWSSANIVPSPSSCSNFRWNATETTATSAKGSFSASCAGDLQVSGTAEGAFAAGTTSVINWKATANATAPGITNCQVTLSGTAELGVDSIRIPYTGDTCVGKVAGVQELKR
jgi:hypothetical protein